MKNYGDLIKKIRKEKQITIVELARRMGVAQAYIARIERGEINPTQEQIEVIHSFLEEKL